MLDVSNFRLKFPRFILIWLLYFLLFVKFLNNFEINEKDKNFKINAYIKNEVNCF